MKEQIKKIGLGIAILSLVGIAETHSKELDIGTQAPDFSLTDIDGKIHRLSDYKGKLVVLEWINHGCPFVKKHYDTLNMQTLQKEAREKGVVWLSICSSAKGKQGHYSSTEWKKLYKEKQMQSHAVLLDENGMVGKLYNAKTTPHLFMINAKGELIYQGAIDDKPSTDKEDVKTAKNYVRQALDEALAGKKVQVTQTKPYGCSVKYK